MNLPFCCCVTSLQGLSTGVGQSWPSWLDGRLQCT